MTGIVGDFAYVHRADNAAPVWSWGTTAIRNLVNMMQLAPAGVQYNQGQGFYPVRSTLYVGQVEKRAMPPGKGQFGGYPMSTNAPVGKLH